MLPIIHNFDHEILNAVLTMQELNIYLYEHPEFLSTGYGDKLLHYLELTLKSPDNNKFKILLLKFKEKLSNTNEYHWTLRHPCTLLGQYLLEAANIDIWDADGEFIIKADLCTFSEQEEYFDLVSYMWKNNCSVCEGHLRYFHNKRMNPFVILMLNYSK